MHLLQEHLDVKQDGAPQGKGSASIRGDCPVTQTHCPHVSVGTREAAGHSLIPSSLHVREANPFTAFQIFCHRSLCSPGKVSESFPQGLRHHGPQFCTGAGPASQGTAPDRDCGPASSRISPGGFGEGGTPP